MERITTKAELLEKIGWVKAVEEQARKGYVEDIEKFQNEKIVEIIRQIKTDEDKHIGLLQELIDLLS